MRVFDPFHDFLKGLGRGRRPSRDPDGPRSPEHRRPDPRRHPRRNRSGAGSAGRSRKSFAVLELVFAADDEQDVHPGGELGRRLLPRPGGTADRVVDARALRSFRPGRATTPKRASSWVDWASTARVRPPGERPGLGLVLDDDPACRGCNRGAPGSPGGPGFADDDDLPALPGQRRDELLDLRRRWGRSRPRPRASSGARRRRTSGETPWLRMMTVPPADVGRRGGGADAPASRGRRSPGGCG